MASSFPDCKHKVIIGTPPELTAQVEFPDQDKLPPGEHSCRLRGCL